MKSVIFNTKMVNDILDGRKKQFRKVIDINKNLIFGKIDNNKAYFFNKSTTDFERYSAEIIKVSKYKAGDILYVREPSKIEKFEYEFGKWNMKYKFLSDSHNPKYLPIPKRFIKEYSANIFKGARWIEKLQGVPNGCIIEMARIFLKVANVRVEKDESNAYEFVYEFEKVDV